MDTTTMIAGDKVQLIVGLDLSKHYFQVAVADLQYRMVGKHRLTREKLARFMSNHPKCQVVMEACGTSNYWARRFMAMGHEVKLLPAQYVKAYVKRNKTDAADAQALIEASRSEMRPVPVKTLEQQQLQQLHRFRARWQADRTARINGLRGCLREFGIDIPKGALTGIAAIREALEIPDNGLPDVLRPFIEQVLKEIADISEQVEGVDRTLKSLTRKDVVVQRLQQISGVGIISSTALRAAVHDINRFPTGRHFASWVGLTATERSSGERRRLGKISKAGDTYLRTLLVHGARSVLSWANKANAKGLELDRLRRWALDTQQRIRKNKAVVALANKLARIVWATWKHERDYDGNWSKSAAAKTQAA